MTRQWYIEHGFKVSALIEQVDIDRAERDVTEAYVAPIVGGAEPPESVVQNAVANLTFLLLLKRSVALTRAGAKIKTGYNSQEATDWQKLEQAATSCHLALEMLRDSEGTNAAAEIVDICKIYWKSNFIAL